MEQETYCLFFVAERVSVCQTMESKESVYYRLLSVASGILPMTKLIINKLIHSINIH